MSSRNTRLAAVVTASLALALSATGHAQRGNPVMQNGGESIDAMVADYMRDNQVPGMALAIVQAPYVTRATGYGVSDPASGRLASPHTLFRLGRLAEAYTAVAVMQLVEAGKIHLDDPVKRYVTDGPPDVTVRQLVARRDSGAATTAALLRAVVAKAAGQPYERFVRANQLDRLGLEHTVFASELAALTHERIAPGAKHRRFLAEPSLIDPAEEAVGSAAPEEPVEGVLYASAVDVSVWDIALAGEILVKDPELRKLLYQPGRAADGTSLATSGPWDFPGHPGLMVTTGGDDGFSSLLSRFTDPRELVCVTLLANRAGLDLSQLARRIAGAYDPAIGPPPQAAGLRAQQSPYPIAVTIERLAAALRAGGALVTVRDHAKAAAGVGTPSGADEILFSDPVDGEQLMQAAPAAPAEPLRALVWEEHGEVWIAASDPVAIARRRDFATLGDLALRMRARIDAALATAVSP